MGNNYEYTEPETINNKDDLINIYIKPCVPQTQYPVILLRGLSASLSLSVMCFRKRVKVPNSLLLGFQSEEVSSSLIMSLSGWGC